MLTDHEELLRVLAGTFGLHFPPGMRFQFGAHSGETVTSRLPHDQEDAS
jgi:hypothetical protein